MNELLGKIQLFTTTSKAQYANLLLAKYIVHSGHICRSVRVLLLVLPCRSHMTFSELLKLFKSHFPYVKKDGDNSANLTVLNVH